MKAKILLLIIISGLLLCCRSKHKMTATYKESKKETARVKVDSMNVENLKTTQSIFTDALVKENKNELSGEILISGTSDLSNPFVFHNVVGSDTLQSISIRGNAEYSINNHYAKSDNKKSEVKREEFTSIIKEVTQKAVSKENIKEGTSVVSEETKKIKSTGFQAGAWIVIAAVAMFLILIFFTFKYFKK